jgi:tRNA pseudouridine13 synthase
VNELLGPNAAFPDFNREARELFSQGKFQDAILAYPREARTESKVLYALSQGKSPRQAILSMDDSAIRFYLTAFQSAAFNAVLDARLALNTFATLELGDVALKHENHAVFDIDEAAMSDPTTTERLQKFEISPSGPMWGSRMAMAKHTPGEIERSALAAMGITPADLTKFDENSLFQLEGKRRPLRVPVIDPEVEGGIDEHGTYIRCAFELPRGSFATVVMREIMKPQDATLVEEIDG